MMRALVSIGTNSTRLLILDDGRRVASESRGTRLGSGIGESGTIAPEARRRTLSAVDAYVTIARRCGAEQIDAISTSVLRRARDGDAFGAVVARRVGIAPRILTGAEEATYSFLGATASRACDEPVAVLDVGGGSSELAIGIPARARIAGEVERTLSREIGAVRLSERHPLLLGARALEAPERGEVEGAARADAAAVLAPFADVRGFAHLVAVGGTAFTAAAMVADGVHDGAVLTRADCARIVDDLLGRDLESRRRVARIRPQRADILPAGLIVIDEACRLLGVDAVTVSESDLLQGYLSSPAFRAVPLAPESPRASRTEAAG